MRGCRPGAERCPAPAEGRLGAVSTQKAAIEAAKQLIMSAQQQFADWPMAKPQIPGAVHTDVDLYETSGFDDPRLVLYTGISLLPSVSVGWSLFGAARNVQPGHPALPHAAKEALADTNTLRALQFLAVDHPETDEAAIEALTVPGVARSLVGLAAAAHREHESNGAARLQADVGTTIYALHRGPVSLGASTADVVVIGSPIWITDHQDRGQ